MRPTRFFSTLLVVRGRSRRLPAPATLGLVILLVLAFGCLRAPRRPYSPARPWLPSDLGGERPGWAVEPFPERHLDEILTDEPPQVLARISEIYRQIALLDGPEPSWRLAPVEAEIDSISRAVGGLGLGMGSLFRLRVGRPRLDEAATFRRAAILQLRWGLALMRTGSVNRRAWGAERLRAATSWDPESPIPVLVLAGYQEVGGFWSNERDILDAWAREHGANDIIDLQRLRKRERVWTVERDPESLQAALRLGREIADRRGGYASSPAWLNLEHARLLLHADSLQAAETAARLALRGDGDHGDAAQVPVGPGSAIQLSAERDPIGPSSAAQAELLLGVVQVRRLEYDRADEHFQRAISLAGSDPSLAGLVSWLLVPWDLWTTEEQAEFDRESDRAAWLARWWRAHDPILATPRTQEGRVEYLRRVGEAWFGLEGVDLAVPGPLTDPGRVMLRYGRPDEWTYSSGEHMSGTSVDPDSIYGVRRRWRYQYDFRGRAQPLLVKFQDDIRGSHFAALDSLRGPDWPPWLFDFGLEGRSYRLNTSPARFRRSDGGVRLLVCQDTWLPEYSVRYPLQGLRFRGEARVRTALFRPLDDALVLEGERETLLDRESEVRLAWTMRRRAGVQVLDLHDAGPLRLASQLVLRDTTGQVVAMAVDNNRDLPVEPFAERTLDASSLVLLPDLPDSLDDKQEWEIAPGRLVHGPDLLRTRLIPRADHHFLPGENFAWYLEVYNLGQRRGATEAEMVIVVEHLDADGEMEYSVGTRGPTQSLTRRRVSQWNIFRSLGLGNLEPGAYRLRVEILDRATGQQVARTTDFRLDTVGETVARYGWDRLVNPRN